MADASQPNSFDLAMETALNQYWNTYEEGVQPDASAIEPTIAHALQHIHRLGAARPPDPAFTQRLRGELFPVDASTASLADPVDGFRMNGRSEFSNQPRKTTARMRQEREWSRAALFALVLLLAVGAGYVLFELGPFDDEERTTVPAAVIPEGTPSPVPKDDGSLISITIPAELLPSGDDVSWGFAHETIQPGTQTNWPPPGGFCCPGVRLDFVLEGSYVVRVEGPVFVFRAGSGRELESVLPGVDIVLFPGDAMLSRLGDVAVTSNEGSVLVQLLSAPILSGGSSIDPMPIGWIPHDWEPGFDLNVPPGPATLQLSQTTLAPDTALPEAPGVFRLALTVPRNAEGTPVVGYAVGTMEDGRIANIGKVTAIVYVATLDPLGIEGSPVAGSPTP